jgi:F0F1-type ATP synthase assembly protein I
MPENERKEKPGNSGASGYAKYTSMGFQMIAVIGIFTFAGHKIDQSAHHSTQWVTALLALIGVGVSLYLVIRSVRS